MDGGRGLGKISPRSAGQALSAEKQRLKMGNDLQLQVNCSHQAGGHGENRNLGPGSAMLHTQLLQNLKIFQPHQRNVWLAAP